MRRISAIAFDIDGTLLDSRGRVSEATARALRVCARRGIRLYAATGRPARLVFRPGEAPEELAFLGRNGAFMQGAAARDESLGVRASWALPAALVGELVGWLTAVRPGIRIVIQGVDEAHSFRPPVEEPFVALWGCTPEELVPYDEASRHACAKIVALDEREPLHECRDEIGRRWGGRVTPFLTDSGHWLQLVAGGADKARALLHLTALHGIPAEEVAVFGDDLPDLGMFQAFGAAVAMGNAPDALKSAATFVTRSNDEDGVAHAMREYLGMVEAI